MGIFKDIVEHENLTEREQSIRTYLIQHPKKLYNMTAHDLGEATYSSAAAVTRFCKKLGCRGYQDFRIHFLQDYREQSGEMTGTNSMGQMTDAGTDMPVLLREAVIYRQAVERVIRENAPDRINKAFHTNLNVWDLQKHQTIRDLSDYLDNSNTVSEEKNPREGHLDHEALVELPQSLKDLWVSCMKSHQDNMAYQMFFVFSFDENTNASLLEKAWNRIVEHQEALRLTFIQHRERLLGKFIPYAYQALPVEDIDAKDFPEKSRDFYTQTELSFKERLFNARLLHLSDGKFKLCVVIHHLITDGLSYQLMQQNLKAYYEDAKDSRPSVDEVISYRQY